MYFVVLLAFSALTESHLQAIGAPPAIATLQWYPYSRCFSPRSSGSNVCIRGKPQPRAPHRRGGSSRSCRWLPFGGSWRQFSAEVNSASLFCWKILFYFSLSKSLSISEMILLFLWTSLPLPFTVLCLKEQSDRPETASAILCEATGAVSAVAVTAASPSTALRVAYRTAPRPFCGARLSTSQASSLAY